MIVSDKHVDNFTVYLLMVTYLVRSFLQLRFDAPPPPSLYYSRLFPGYAPSSFSICFTFPILRVLCACLLVFTSSLSLPIFLSIYPVYFTRTCSLGAIALGVKTEERPTNKQRLCVTSGQLPAHHL
jgi:hypothetical protein